MEPERSPIQRIIFDSLVEHQAREKRYGYDLVDKLVEDLNAAGYSIIHDDMLDQRRQETYWRGYKNGVTTLRKAAEWSERRAAECLRFLASAET